MTAEREYIEVAVALPVAGTFTYRVAEADRKQVRPGIRVLVPFGRRRVTGYVLGAAEEISALEVKTVLAVLDEDAFFPASMLPFFRWLSDYYKHPLGDVIRQALPSGLAPADFVLVSATARTADALNKGRLSRLEKQTLQMVSDQGPLPLQKLSGKLGRSLSAGFLDGLERGGLIERSRKLTPEGSGPRLARYVRLQRPLPQNARRSPVRRKIVSLLESEGEMSFDRLKPVAASAPQAVKALAADGIVSIVERREYRDPFGEPIRPDTAPRLTPDQRAVVTSICDSMGKGYRTCLLNGITGSGKTEVYLRVAAEAVERGWGVLVLVPEIALITQVERRFRARFGHRVAILHSGLSAGQRYDQWTRIMDRKARIAIGARSAIFAPFEKLGVIIVDEEHDTSYKQESPPRYNARDLAVVRALQSGCIALLGSATPSIQTLFNVERGKFEELILPERIHSRPLPTISVVDLRRNRGFRGSLRFITDELQQAMADVLSRNEQVLLFLNRRGFATFPVCGGCGAALRCRHCDITLTLHRKDNAFRCHYCGFSRPADTVCDACGQDAIKPLGLGTEKVEAAVKELFPSARLARMDRDTTRRKGALVTLLRGLRRRTIDILIGTQMVAKGHDYPASTLVGIVCADLSLSFPDFRAGERTFQLLAQVAGRAGRGRRPGRVILQTYNPDHFSIAAARRQDVRSFYDQEIGFRRALNYPPFSRLMLLKISGKDKSRTAAWAERTADCCRALKRRDASGFEAVEIMGPIEASLSKVAGRFRWQIMLKCGLTGRLHDYIGRLMAEHSRLFANHAVRVSVDVDPYFMM